MDYQKILEDIYTEVKPYRRAGHQADYIPALERVNPDQFGMSLTTVDGRSFHVAESEVRFSIQSISKVYSLALCLSLRGEKLWERVGKEPSGNAFNSIVQLEYEDGIPRNPFINAGALVTADILVSCLEYPEGDFLRFVRALAGDDSIGANPEVAESEYLTSHLNQSSPHAEVSWQSRKRGGPRDSLLPDDVFRRDELPPAGPVLPALCPLPPPLQLLRP